jgi:hypothetical protein
LRRPTSRLLLHIFAPVLALVFACTGARLYYVYSEVPKVEGKWAVGPGPWPAVPAVLSDSATVPDDLVLATLEALMALPGAADSCDAYGKPRPDAAEYCVATYRTPEDWRVTWPIRDLVGPESACKPPFGGVDDADFGRDLPVFGYAHNHTCGLFASSRDLTNFPVMRTPAGTWMLVGYATTPNGKPALDAQGQPLPAWSWLATGHADEPRFYKWNPAGEVFRWNEGKKHWEFQANCKPRSSTMLERKPLPPQCSPEIVDWY